MEIPRLTGLFNPVPYEAPKDATANNINTIAARQDPAGTLERIQADQIAKSMADLKLDGILPMYQQHALKGINGYIDYSKNLYKGNRGFNRMQLSGEQMLQEKQKYTELLTNINAMKGLSEDYRRTLQQAASDVARGTITAEQYALFEKELDAKNAAAESVDKMPMAHAVYNNYLTRLPYDWADMNKDLEAVMKDARPVKGVDRQGDERYNTETLDPRPYVGGLFNYNQKFRNFWLKQAGGDPVEAEKRATEQAERFRIGNKTFGGNVKGVNVNVGSGKEDKRVAVTFTKYSGDDKFSYKGERIRPVEEMDLSSTPVPWEGSYEGSPATGHVVKVLTDDRGAMWQKVNIKHTPDGGVSQSQVIYIPYVSNTKQKLQDQGFNVDELNKRFGKKQSTTPPVTKSWRPK